MKSNNSNQTIPQPISPASQQNQQVQQIDKIKSLKTKWILLGGFIVIVSLILIGGFLFIQFKNGPPKKEIITKTFKTNLAFVEAPVQTLLFREINEDEDLKTIEGGFPILLPINIVDSNSINPIPSFELEVYSFSKGKTINTGNIIQALGAAVGFGNTHPLASYNFKYTAYIDNQNNIRLLDNDSLKSMLVANINKSTEVFITDWSPDSRYLIYFLFTGSFQGGISFEGPNLEYFSYNLETKETKRLPIDFYGSFINNKEILSKPTNDKNSFVSLNIENFKFNLIQINDVQYGNFSITKDGKFWAFQKYINSQWELFYAQFPQSNVNRFIIGGTTPLISPQGTNVAYVKNDSVWIYSAKTKQSIKYFDGRAVQWLNENILIINSNYSSGTDGDFYILNLNSNSKEKIK
nr:hypothetical protein [Candidatus Levybacteria bacterium]